MVFVFLGKVFDNMSSLSKVIDNVVLVFLGKVFDNMSFFSKVIDNVVFVFLAEKLSTADVI